MVSKEEFNKVFKDTSREGILNQFYYEHIELRKMIDNFNELEKWLDKKEKLTFNSWNKGIHEVQRKLQELKGEDKE